MVDNIGTETMGVSPAATADTPPVATTGTPAEAQAGTAPSALADTPSAAPADVPPAALLSALSQAFTYPWNGLAETVEPLRALDDAALGAGVGARVRPLVDEVVAVSGTFDDRTAEQLAYTRLFIGSFKMEAPPYASYYLEENHTINGQAAVEAEAVYAQFGLELDSKEIAPADHLRYLLAFLALMAQRYEETGEPAFAQAYADFRDDYILTWIDQCQALVNRYAEHPYYPALVALIVAVLTDDGTIAASKPPAPEGE